MPRFIKRRPSKNRLAKIGRLLSLLFVVLPALNAMAEISVMATVDRNQMSEDDTFTLTLSVSSETSVNIPAPQLPNFSDFDVLNNWSSGQVVRTTFSGGKFVSQVSQNFSYMLAPKKAGRLKLSSIPVRVDGKVYNTKPITIQVIASSGQQRPRQQAQPRGRQRRPNNPLEEMEDIFSQLLQRNGMPGYRTQPVNPKEAFFIQVEVDKTEAYVGEQITASWFLYTRGQVRDIDTLKYPSLNGFWKEDIDIATRLNFQNEVVNGIVYKKALLASYALFPIKPGRATIDPYKAKCTVLTPSRFGFSKGRKYTKASKPIKINVVEVPKEGQPKDYSGAVGAFTVKASLDSDNVPVNQPVTLKIRFEGKGNAKLLDLPGIEFPPSLEQYDTQSEAKFFKNGTSYKEFEVLLIPREPGQVTMPAFDISMFDPIKAQYYSQSTPELNLNVVPGAGNESIPSAPLAVADKEDDQGPRLPGIALTFSEGGSSSTQTAAVVWSSAFLLSFMFLGWRMVVELGLGKKRKDIQKLLAARMKQVHLKLDNGDWRGVGVEMTNAIYFTLGELSGEGGANVQIDQLMLKAPPSVRREVGDPLKKQMARFEALSFAPEAVVGDLKEKSELKKLVSAMEKTLQKAIKLGLGATESSSPTEGASTSHAT